MIDVLEVYVAINVLFWLLRSILVSLLRISWVNNIFTNSDHLHWPLGDLRRKTWHPVKWAMWMGRADHMPGWAESGFIGCAFFFSLSLLRVRRSQGKVSFWISTALFTNLPVVSLAGLPLWVTGQVCSLATVPYGELMEVNVKYWLSKLPNLL